MNLHGLTCFNGGMLAEKWENEGGKAAFFFFPRGFAADLVISAAIRLVSLVENFVAAVQSGRHKEMGEAGELFVGYNPKLWPCDRKNDENPSNLVLSMWTL